MDDRRLVPHASCRVPRGSSIATSFAQRIHHSPITGLVNTARYDIIGLCSAFSQDRKILDGIYRTILLSCQQNFLDGIYRMILLSCQKNSL